MKAAQKRYMKNEAFKYVTNATWRIQNGRHFSIDKIENKIGRENISMSLPLFSETGIWMTMFIHTLGHLFEWK